MQRSHRVIVATATLWAAAIMCDFLPIDSLDPRQSSSKAQLSRATVNTASPREAIKTPIHPERFNRIVAPPAPVAEPHAVSHHLVPTEQVRTATVQPMPAAQTASIRPERYAKSIACMLTAYGPGYESTGKRPGDPDYGITASGTHATEGKTIAVDPRFIPIGSTVYIEGIGYRTAEDVGGAIKGSHIDVFFNNDDVASAFGVKNSVQVYVLSPSDSSYGQQPANHVSE